MIDEKKIAVIENLLNNKKIIYSKLLSDSFGINCIQIKTLDERNYIVKYYKKKNFIFNAIKSEADNLIFFKNLKFKLFPEVECYSEDVLIMSYINNNNILPNKTKKDFLDAIVHIHSNKYDKFGFDFDTQIGGLKQKNEYNISWIDFYRENRLGYIYNLINSSEKMDNSINVKIELLLNKLENYIPDSPSSSLLHGDLWEGNILFNDCNFVGFIDPGSFYGHNELEIAYLRWFNPKFISDNFLEQYNEVIKIDDYYKTYEPIYQLYYSLLNVYLWDRIYVKDVMKLLDKIKL